MLNKLLCFVRQQNMICPGDKVICALSGGGDSVALFWSLYLLREKLDFTLEAAHFNHGLRGDESDRDEAFVKDLCARYDIPLHLGRGAVVPGPKGLEAAARDARYGFLLSLPGKIATAHTADDNAETVLMHMVRGTGLKGLGGITPIRGKLIRPMLTVTGKEARDFLEEYYLQYIHDSSNDTDDFLRNRLRHRVMPGLKQENPNFSQTVSHMALRLRQDSSLLQELATDAKTLEIAKLRDLHPALRSRVLTMILEDFGVREPTADHVALLENVVFSEKPSAAAAFPGGITLGRCYDRLEKLEAPCDFRVPLNCPGVTELPELGLRIYCDGPGEADFTVCPQGQPVVRSRQTGDAIRTPGGTKTLKKLFIEKKIPASQRSRVPVIADEGGVLGVRGIGVNLDRVGGENAIRIRFEEI